MVPTNSLVHFLHLITFVFIILFILLCHIFCVYLLVFLYVSVSYSVQRCHRHGPFVAEGNHCVIMSFKYVKIRECEFSVLFQLRIHSTLCIPLLLYYQNYLKALLVPYHIFVLLFLSYILFYALFISSTALTTTLTFH